MTFVSFSCKALLLLLHPFGIWSLSCHQFAYLQPPPVRNPLHYICKKSWIIKWIKLNEQNKSGENSFFFLIHHNKLSPILFFIFFPFLNAPSVGKSVPVHSHFTLGHVLFMCILIVYLLYWECIQLCIPLDIHCLKLAVTCM